MPETNLIEAPTDAERKFLKELSKDDVRLEVIIPDQIDATGFNTSVGAVCKVIAAAGRKIEDMMPALGRLLNIARDNPELWRDRYPTFEEYKKGEIYPRVGEHRSACYFAENMARRMPDMPPEKMKAIGRRKLELVLSAVPKGQEHGKDAQKLIKAAESMTSRKLEEHIESVYHIPKGSNDGAILKVACNQDELISYMKFLDNPKIHAICGTAKWSDVLTKAIATVEPEWLARIQTLEDHIAQTSNAEELQGL